MVDKRGFWELVKYYLNVDLRHRDQLVRLQKAYKLLSQDELKIDLIIAKYRHRQYQGNHRFTWLGLILLLVIVLVIWTTSLIKMALVLMLLIVLIVLLIGTLIACQLSLNRLRVKIDLMTSILETRG